MASEFVIKNGLIVSGTIVTTGNITISGSTVATQSWVQSQGYLTSFSETDTLASVTGRGASTSTPVTFNSNVTLGNNADLVFQDLAGTFPTTGKGFDWTLNNDGARIYAIQPSSDSIDFVFQLRDNATTNDRFVFWVDEWQGPAYDKYPLIISGGTQFDLKDSALYTNSVLRLSNSGVLQNVTGNISMFTNDAGYLTSVSDVWVNTTGDTMTGDLTLQYAYPRINFYDTDDNSDYSLINSNGSFSLYDITNNVHRFWVTSAGNIGIGTTSPNATLQVNGVGGDTTPAFRIIGSAAQTFNWASSTEHASLTAGQTSIHLIGKANSQYNQAYFGYRHVSDGSSSNMVTIGMYAADYLVNILGNGNVGIGTSSPTAALQIVNSSRALAVYRIQGTNRTTFYDNDFAVNNDGGGADGFIYGSNVGGSFPFNGYGEVIMQANPRTGYSNGISFVTGTTAPTIKMRIVEGGNVGIGTTAPDEKLQVVGNIKIQNETGLITDYGPLVGRYNTSQVYVGTGGNYSIVKIGRADGGALNVLSGGNVGIGTTNPIYKLQVVGSAYVNNGTLFIDSGEYLRWGNSNQGIVGVNDSHVAIVSGGATRQTVYADGRTYFPGLDLSISNVNSTGSANYFRGDASHFVLGTGGTLYLNYANTSGSTYIFGTTYINSNVVWHAGNFTPGNYLPLSGGTLTGQLNVHYANGRISVGNGSDNILMGAWDGTNQRIESNTRPIYIVSYGGTVSLGRAGGNSLVINTTSLSYGGAEIATQNYVNTTVESYTSLQSQSDFVDGTLVITSINASVTNGNSFVMEVSGKSYSGSHSPYKLILQGYIYADTFIANSAISYGTTFPGPIKILEYGGNLAFWWPRGSYWNSFDVYVRIADGGNYKTNTVTSIINIAEPSSSKKVSVTPYQSWSSYHFGQSDINNWNTAYSWGNHATAGYLTSVSDVWVNTTGDTMTGSLTFADNADNVRINKNNNWLNLYDPWNNIHLRNGNSGYGVYIDSTIHYWRPHDGSAFWMTLSSTGLGIGVNSPNYKLDVGGTIALRNTSYYSGTYDWSFSQNSSNGRLAISYYGSEKVSVKDDGNVGIGTSSPSYKLHVSTGNTNVAARLENTTSNGSVLELYSSGDGRLMTLQTDHIYLNGGALHFGAENGALYLRSSGYGTVIGGTTVYSTGGNAALSVIGDVISFGANNSDLSYFRRLGVGQFQWQTYNSGNNGEIHLQPYGGNVGIGTTSPGSKLSVFGNNDVFSVTSQTGDTIIPTKLLAQYVGLFNNGSNGHHLYISSSQELGPAEFNITKTWGGILTLGTSGDGTARTRTLYINSNGYVGVGVNPTSGDKMEIAGSLRVHTGNNWDGVQIYAGGADGYIRGIGDETGLHIRSEYGNILLADDRGNVGIGLTTPQRKFDVNNGAGIHASISGGIAPGQFAGLHFGYSESHIGNDNYKKSALVFERTDNHGQGGNASGRIHFLLNNIGGASASSLSHSIMVIDTDASATQGSARVGIGTTSPSTALQVNGVITATGGNSTNWNTAYSWGNHASQSYATTSYVTTQINNLINGAPGALDTLDELAAALGDDANFATTVTNSIAGKMALYNGAGAPDFNTNTTNGVYRNQGGANGPAGGAHVTMFSAFQPDGNYGWQLASHGSDNIYFRYKDANFLSWVQIATRSWVTSQNYVTTTGYNNSNWDTAYGWGNHASAGYALNSSLANYLPLSGGVIGGALTVNGNLTVNGTITENSSIKLKENVETSEGNLEKVVNLRPVTYNKIGSQTTELGLIAEEVAEVYPEFVQYDENGDPVGVHYSRLTAALIGAVKELTNQVQELNKKING